MKKMEEIKFDVEDELPMTLVTPTETTTKETKKHKNTKTYDDDDEPVVSCLRNERITVRFLPKKSGIWGNDPRHVLAGGLAQGSLITYVVPKLEKGNYVNVLTNEEKKFLEEIMGLEDNALSIYKKDNNFWDDSNTDGINKVTLTKDDTYLDLSDPKQYIQYKILLAYKNEIASSLQVLQDRPLPSYRFVLISNGDEIKQARGKMDVTMQCYNAYTKYSDDIDTLRVIIEALEGRPTDKNTKLEFLQTRINELIQKDGVTFLRIITDPLLSTKVLIKRSIEGGVISNRGGMLYLRKDSTPLCGHNEEPTMNIAAKFLNQPKNLEIKFYLEAQLNN